MRKNLLRWIAAVALVVLLATSVLFCSFRSPFPKVTASGSLPNGPQNQVGGDFFNDASWKEFLKVADRTPARRVTRDSDGVEKTIVQPRSNDEIRLQFLMREIKASFRQRGTFVTTVEKLAAAESHAIREFHRLNLKINFPHLQSAAASLDNSSEIAFDRDGTRSDIVDIQDGLNAYSF